MAMSKLQSATSGLNERLYMKVHGLRYGRYSALFLLFSSFTLIFQGCQGGDEEVESEYRGYMREFVESINGYAGGIDSDFIIIPQNGQELITINSEERGEPDSAYLNAIKGQGREDLFYGYDEDNKATPPSEREYMCSFLDIAEQNGVEVLVTDYCWDTAKMNDSYAQNNKKGYISIAADSRDLDGIPSYPSQPYGMNSANITTLSDAKNFLYLLDPSSYPTKADYLDALRGTNYDILIIDLFYDSDQLSTAEVASLKTKANGGGRLVISYMSIGEAEDYRYYWQPIWSITPPSWLSDQNPDWPGNYKVRFWEPEWQALIYGSPDSYLGRILASGFDGVYLDIIDAFEYFED
jgi:cysteinyl-tRNA synthetase